MIRELHVHEIPDTDDYRKHIALHSRNKAIGKSLSITVSMRPRAVGELMNYTVYRQCGPNHPTPLPLNSRNPYDFVRSLSHFDIDHLCVQLPVMDQHLEDSLLLDRKMPRSFFHIQFPRMVFRRLLVSALHDRGDYFFGLFRLACQTLTIHNMTMGLFVDRTLASISPNVPTIRIFFRPCTNADVDLVDKVVDRYCYNHLDDGNPNINDNGDIRLGNKILHSYNNLELIDLDWRRGRYDPDRSDQPSRSLNRQIEMYVKESPPLYYSRDPESGLLVGRHGGPKSVKMSREVEACGCCGRHQLSAVEVCPIAYDTHHGNVANNLELNQLHRPEMKSSLKIGTRRTSTHPEM
jgi:hypothetical protein